MRRGNYEFIGGGIFGVLATALTVVGLTLYNGAPTRHVEAQCFTPRVQIAHQDELAERKIASEIATADDIFVYVWGDGYELFPDDQMSRFIAMVLSIGLH